MRHDTESRDLGYYLGQHYPVTVHSDPEGGFVAEIEELPGCMTQADTLDEVFAAIEEARELWIRTAYNEGQDISLPRDMEEYTGKFLIRAPRTLHRTLVRAAKREGVSLNQYVISLLSAGVSGDLVKGQYTIFNMAHFMFLPDPQSEVWGSTSEVLNWWQFMPREKIRLAGRK